MPVSSEQSISCSLAGMSFCLEWLVPERAQLFYSSSANHSDLSMSVPQLALQHSICKISFVARLG